ncbi:MAG: hypothetical protein FGM54_08355 [Chitinophagaceae bacterium]|nr:hypothetical protein [Chitinophagaceae bacterium]
MDQILLATYTLEYLAFVSVQLNTQQGPVYLYVAIDALTGYAFNLGVHQEYNSTIVLQMVYELTELPEFTERLEEQGKSFTLVMENNSAPLESIHNIIQYLGGDVMVNKPYNHFISNPFLDDMRSRL